MKSTSEASLESLQNIHVNDKFYKMVSSLCAAFSHRELSHDQKIPFLTLFLLFGPIDRFLLPDLPPLGTPELVLFLSARYKSGFVVFYMRTRFGRSKPPTIHKQTPFVPLTKRKSPKDESKSHNNPKMWNKFLSLKSVPRKGVYKSDHFYSTFVKIIFETMPIDIVLIF